MNVGKINSIHYGNISDNKKNPVINNEHKQITELAAATPDYNVNLPQKYYKLGIHSLSNGLELHSYKLANGYRVTIVPMEDSPTTVQNFVNVGSMNETEKIKGISHFLEHMAFNGTLGDNGYLKLSQGDSFKEIEKLGGWTNASTNYAVTDYVNSTPLLNDSDIEKQIKIIAAMTENLSLAENMIKKEKGPVCAEIDMILDNPQTIVLDQTVRTLFNIKSSADELVGGSTKHIKNLTEDDVKSYYEKYYTPTNMNLVITGNVNPDEVIKTVAKNFHSKKQKSNNAYEPQLTSINNTIRKDFISEKATATDIIIGFAGPKSSDSKGKIIFDIMQQYINSADLGINKELKQLNAAAFFSTEKISTNLNNPMFIFYNINSSDKNSEKALKMFFDKFQPLTPPSEAELARIKTKLLQDYKNELEYSASVNNIIGNSIIDGTLDYITNYETILADITKKDIQEFIQNHLNINKAAITLVHPDTNIENINRNYKEAQKISFKGKKEPVNSEKISNQTLINNYNTACYKTQNDNIYFNIKLRFEPQKETNPAVREVLNEILSKGSQKYDETEFNKLEERNNLNITAGTTAQELYIEGNSGFEKFSDSLNLAKEVLNTPRINEEEVLKAIEAIKDSLNRNPDTAAGLYIDYEAEFNPLYTSKSQLINNIENVTVNDVQNLYNSIIENSIGTISFNVPDNKPEFKNYALKEFSSLKAVKPFKHTIPNVFKETSEPIVLIKDKNCSQADIMQLYKFPLENTLKEYAMLEILNNILTSGSEIGLFNTLREKEHLAYSVYSDYYKVGNSGEIACHILTTTDNKENNNTQYDNLKKSINGFHRQINALVNSEYTDQDLESAKKILKANLLQKEGIAAKVNSIDKGLNSKFGIERDNKLFHEIDNITREDIDNLSEKIFSSKPIYSIVASQDTLDANKDYLAKLTI